MRLLIFLFLFVQGATAAPKVQTKYDYYGVYLDNAKSAFEMSRRLTAKTPIATDGRKYHGHAHWHVSWKYRWKETNGTCRVTKVNTKVDLTYTMPKAVSLPTDKTLKKIYKQYYASLVRHEEGHGQIAIDAARSIEKELKATINRGGCRGFNKILNEKGHRILKHYNMLNRRYDQKTQHGKTQGAYLTDRT